MFNLIQIETDRPRKVDSMETNLSRNYAESNSLSEHFDDALVPFTRGERHTYTMTKFESTMNHQ